MANVDFHPVSFDGEDIEGGGNITSKFLRADANNPVNIRTMQAIEANVTGLGPRDVRAQPQASVWRLYVYLASTDQDDVDDMLELFSEEKGLVYLRAQDGAASPVTWRVACRVIGVERVDEATTEYVIALRVPNPVWEADTATTDSKLNQVSSPIAISLTNAGNRKARPKFTITADFAKDATAEDYRYSLRGFIVNRSSRPWSNLPVYLFDSSAAQARLATDTAASGAVVAQTTGATTLDGNITDSQTTIDLVSAASFPTAGMAIIDFGGTEEQIRWTGKSSNQLTGVVRGIGGTTAASHTSGDDVNVSGTLANGDDTRVWLDDIEVDRWLVGWGGTASDVVINVSMPKGIGLTPAAALTASSPATGESITFVEGVARLPEKGFLILQNEVIHYRGKSGKGVTGITRAVWGTTAASHATSVTAWANPRRYIVATGYAKAGAPPSPSTKRPCIQLPGSSNNGWRWGDESDDPDTVFFDPLNPDRTAGWTPGFDQDGNDISPLMQISESKTALTFKDDEPGDGGQPYNFAAIDLPPGVRSGATTAIIADWTPAAEILNLELFTKDDSGRWVLKDELQQTATDDDRPLPASLTAIAYGVKLKGRYNIATGHKGTGDSVRIENSAPGGANIKGAVFTLHEETRIKRIGALLALSTAGSVDINMLLYAGDIAETGAQLIFNDDDQSVTSVTAALFYLTPETPLTLPAGTYTLVIGKLSALGSTPHVDWTTRSGGRYSTQNIRVDNWNGSDWEQAGHEIPYILVVSDYDQNLEAPIHPQQPVRANTTGARTGTTASFDGVSITFPLTQYPYVHRNTAFVSGTTSGAQHHCIGVIACDETGDTLTIDKWMKPASTLEIDANERTVTYFEDSVEYPAQRTVRAINSADPFTLAPGANTLSYTDPSLVSPGQIDIVSQVRSVKV